jgi:PAS domain S-box-containing protein
VDEPSFWVDHMHPDDREWAVEYCIQETNAGRNHEFEYRMIAADGRTVWLRDKVYVSPGAGGQRLSRGIMIDITTAKRHEDALRAREAELELIARMTPLALVRCDRNMIYRFVNRAAADLLGSTPEQIVGRPVGDVVGSAAFSIIRPHAERALLGETVEYEAEIPYPHAGVRWMHVIYTPDRQHGGEVVGWFASIIDITQRKQAEEHKKLLIDELNHRVRNTLAVVQSIAQQTLKGEAATEASRRAFEGRLLALAKAHGLLTRTSWESANLAEVVEDAIQTNIAARDRITIRGRDMMLGPKPALAIAMALHELFTNAIKYGSLSNEAGWVEIAWSPAEEARFQLTWSEHGGPPVSPPVRRGYGSAMMEQALARDLQGEVLVEYRREGLHCAILAPYDVRRRWS